MGLNFVEALGACKHPETCYLKEKKVKRYKEYERNIKTYDEYISDFFKILMFQMLSIYSKGKHTEFGKHVQESEAGESKTQVVTGYDSYKLQISSNIYKYGF